MAGTVISLSELGTFEPREYFQGPWESLEVKRLRAGEAWACKADKSEAGVYVVAGGGTAQIGDVLVPVEEGTALMFVRDSSGTLVADNRGIELFVARVRFAQ